MNMLRPAGLLLTVAVALLGLAGCDKRDDAVQTDTSKAAKNASIKDATRYTPPSTTTSSLPMAPLPADAATSTKTH